jgi:broad specificity phosphatase PhoE
MLLYFIRHGETLRNRLGVIMGHSPAPLSDLGRQQAASLGAAIRQVPFDAVYASDLERAAETAGIVFGDRTVHLDPRLREKHGGEFTGLRFEECQERWPELVAEYQRDPIGARPPGGESSRELEARILAFVAEMAGKHPGQRVAVVTHGGPVRSLVAHLLGIPITQLAPFAYDNCAVTVVEWGERPRLRAWNWLPDLGGATW